MRQLITANKAVLAIRLYALQSAKLINARQYNKVTPIVLLVDVHVVF